MQNIVVYSLLRLVLLAATVGIVWWIAGISLLSTLAAIIIATLLSILLLGGARRKATSTMEGWGGERKQRRAARRSAPAPDSDESVEDAAIERIADREEAGDEDPEVRAAQDTPVEKAGSDRPVTDEPGTDLPATDPSEGEAEREER